jgi:hypothetical protein
MVARRLFGVAGGAAEASAAGRGVGQFPSRSDCGAGVVCGKGYADQEG